MNLVPMNIPVYFRLINERDVNYIRNRAILLNLIQFVTEYLMTLRFLVAFFWLMSILASHESTRG